MRRLLLVGCLIAGGACESSARGAEKPAASSVQLAATPEQEVGTLAPGTGIPVGQRIADVAGIDLDEHRVALSSVLERGPMMLVFYRGGWCPYCSLEIKLLAESQLDFERRGVSLVALSADKPDEGLKTRTKHEVPFLLLSDSDATVINAFHVVNKVTDAEYQRLRGKHVDIEKASGKTHHEIAIPSYFLIDRDGVVRWAHSDPKWQVRPTTQQLLRAVDNVFPSDD